jgi:hypothetical protein
MFTASRLSTVMTGDKELTCGNIVQYTESGNYPALCSYKQSRNTLKWSLVEIRVNHLRIMSQSLHGDVRLYVFPALQQVALTIGAMVLEWLYF